MSDMNSIDLSDLRARLRAAHPHRRSLEAAEQVVGADEADDLLRRAAKEGIEPLIMGPHDKRFWSGYDDRTLFEKMGVLRWYEHFYAPWSDASHGQPRGIVRASEQCSDRAAF